MKNSQKRIISLLKEELTNIVKSENLIDIRTPSFINVKLDLTKKNNLIFLNSKNKKIDQIEEIFVLEFNKDYVNMKIKYLGKLERMLNQLKKENIILQLVNNEWLIKIYNDMDQLTFRFPFPENTMIKIIMYQVTTILLLNL